MSHSKKSSLMKVLFIGILIALLVYLFHPGVGHMSLIINGEPISQPWAGMAALPTMLLVMMFSAVLLVMMFFGVGLFIFLGAALFAFLGIMIVAPYFWPVLLIILLVISLMSIGNNDGRET